MSSRSLRMLDLFCGRWGWSKAFAARGWHCVGVDLTAPPDIPANCEFWQDDILNITCGDSWLYIIRHPLRMNAWINANNFDFICASSPCEQFSVHGMKHFHPNPPYPELGIKLFNRTRDICEKSGIPYVMENVRAAQQFVGDAVHHCGPFYLWGTGVPALIPQKAWKKDNFHAMPGNIREKVLKAGLDMREARNMYQQTPGHPRRHELVMTGGRIFGSATKSRKEATAAAAEIPPELASAVADYAEWLVSNRERTATLKLEAAKPESF